jgi:FkbM family methyltransferase
MLETVLQNGIAISYLNKRDLRFMYYEMPSYFQHNIHVREGDTVVDIGANIGLFSLWVHKLANGDVSVYAFEPIPPVFEVLRQNMQRTASKRMRAFAYGISNTSCTQQFAYYPRASLGSSAYPDEVAKGMNTCRQVAIQNIKKLPRAGPIARCIPEFLLSRIGDWALKKNFQAEYIRCEVRTLSSVIQEHHLERIDLLKVDAEHAEVDVLNGIEPGDWPKIRQAVIEIHDGQVDDVSRLLEQGGLDQIVVDQLDIQDGSNQFLLFASRTS